MELEQNSIVVGSVTIDSAFIESGGQSTPTNYFHGMVEFEFTQPVIVNEGLFTVRLKVGTFTYNSTAYFAWVKPHDNKYITEEYTPQDISENSFGLELWEWK
jgi:hypothetical protein